MVIDHIFTHPRLVLRKSEKHLSIGAHNVIVSTGHAKKCVPNPKVIIYHNLKYHTACSMMF